jgi:hypothetical protein
MSTKNVPLHIQVGRYARELKVLAAKLDQHGEANEVVNAVSTAAACLKYADEIRLVRSGE